MSKNKRFEVFMVV